MRGLRLTRVRGVPLAGGRKLRRYSGSSPTRPPDIREIFAFVPLHEVLIRSMFV